MRSFLVSSVSLISIHQQPLSVAPQINSSPHDSQTDGSLYFRETKPSAFFSFMIWNFYKRNRTGAQPSRLQSPPQGSDCFSRFAAQCKRGCLRSSQTKKHEACGSPRAELRELGLKLFDFDLNRRVRIGAADILDLDDKAAVVVQNGDKAFFIFVDVGVAARQFQG